MPVNPASVRGDAAPSGFAPREWLGSAELPSGLSAETRQLWIVAMRCRRRADALAEQAAR